MKTINKIPRCPKCGLVSTYARIRTRELVCRRCGYVGKREEFFEEENPKSKGK